MAKKASRQSFGETLEELGAKYPNVVALDADLSKSTMSGLFAKKYPERFFEFGIAEANMIGAAAGMALSGKIPFACSFACFITGRFDTIRISIAYSQANVKLVGTHAGIGIGEDGYSQMGLEDLGVMRTLPTFTVIQPCDDVSTQHAVEFAAAHDGPVYLRFTRQKLEDVHRPDFQFEAGKGVVLAEGSDLTIMATGGTVYHALQAKELLAKNNINARIVDIHTIKPIDTQLCVRCAKETGGIMTVEDHNIYGGLGSAVCEALAENHPAPVKRWGVLDTFGESGTSDELYHAYKLDAQGIAEAASEFQQKLSKQMTPA